MMLVAKLMALGLLGAAIIVGAGLAGSTNTGKEPSPAYPKSLMQKSQHLKHGNTDAKELDKNIWR